MTRVIKFRAWSIRESKMYNVDAVDFSGGTIRQGDPCFVEDNKNGGCFLLSNSVLMQYTGLQDENGVDVYEGDIIKGQSNCIGEVLFSLEDCAFIFRSKTGAAFLNEDYLSNFEIIGNIHEHKDLLSDS